MHLFLILTPFLLLAIIALLGFAGCSSFAGTDDTGGFRFLTTSPLPPATVGVHYGTAMSAAGGVMPFHWTVVGTVPLPAGLTMDDSGNISGTPTGPAGSYTVQIQVMDSTTSTDPKKPAVPQVKQDSFEVDVNASTTAPTVSAINPTSGPAAGGTAITVGGSNFVGGATLALGGVAATGVKVVSATTLNATTGAHAAGAVDVVVTNPDTQFATLAKGFNYIAPPAAVTHSGVTDIATPAGVSTTTIQSSVIPLPGAVAKLVVVTVAWGGGGAIVGGVPTFVSGGGGATFQAVSASSPWNNLRIQTFFANAVPAGSIQVKVQLTVASPNSAKLCTSAYDNAAPGNPTYGPSTTPNGKTGATLQAASAINASPQDLVYAIGFAATSAGAFPGGITITPGAGFTAEPSAGNPLVEDKQITASGNVTPTATSSGGATSLWYMFAMGIKHA
jgi:hypothetical protein